MSYDNSCKITYMDAERQDPIAEIEQAVVALRHFRPLGRGRMPHVHGFRGTHDRSLGGAARFRLLGALRDRDGMSVSDIADVIGVDQPRASRLVNDSAERGLVTRRADEKDARRSVVQLTDAGRAMLTTANASRRTAVTEAVSDFTPDEAAQFAALLTRFVAGWTQHDGGHGAA